MDSSPAALRYERKFLAHGCSLDQVLTTVRRHPALFRQVYPPRTVNNLYLDSVSLRDYADHVAGIADRVKTRIRWYGSPAGAIARPALERKFRRGTVSGKLSYSLPALDLALGAPLAALDLAAAWAPLPDAIRALVSPLRPALVNRYQRRYFLSGDGQFRLTVDWDLEFLAPAVTLHPLRPTPPVVILELKYGPAQAEAAGEVSGRLPYRLTRCSKYVLGIEATRGR